MGGGHAGSGLEVGAPEKRLSSHTVPLSVGRLGLPPPCPPPSSLLDREQVSEELWFEVL